MNILMYDLKVFPLTSMLICKKSMECLELTHLLPHTQRKIWCFCPNKKVHSPFAAVVYLVPHLNIRGLQEHSATRHTAHCINLDHNCTFLLQSRLHQCSHDLCLKASPINALFKSILTIPPLSLLKNRGEGKSRGIWSPSLPLW